MHPNYPMSVLMGRVARGLIERFLIERILIERILIVVGFPRKAVRFTQPPPEVKLSATMRTERHRQRQNRIEEFGTHRTLKLFGSHADPILAEIT